MLDLVVRNGRIVDGTGNPWVLGDIGIKDGKIVALRRGIETEALRTIDAKGKVVSPGFIDLHTHSDLTVLGNPRAESSIHQGVTTEGIGMCGSSPYPLSEQQREIAGGLLADFSGRPGEPPPEVNWTTLGGWRETVMARGGVAINLAPNVGHGAIRTTVMGAEGDGGEAVHPTAEQMAAMKGHVEQAMADGAFGLSTGLRYAPGRNATTTEVVELAQIVARYGGNHISHMRSEEERVVSSVRELIEISERAGLPGSATHHKAMFPDNWGAPHATLQLMDEARARGVEVMCDFYPWTYAAQSNLGGNFFPAAPAPAEGATKDLAYVLGCMRDDAIWAEMKAQLHAKQADEVAKNSVRREQLEPLGVMVPDVWDPKVLSYVVHSRAHPEVLWHSMGDIGRVKGQVDYWDAMRQIYLDDEGETYIAGGGMLESDLITIMKHPVSAVSTDSWVIDGPPNMLSPNLMPHPRNYGTFPLVLGKYVRELGVLTLEDAIRKMTGLPAQFLGLADRGLLRPGMWADVVIFDPATIACLATYSEPARKPAGIECVVVNGSIAVDRGEHSGSLSGQVLRHRGRG